jgi:hypothetical protein
MNSALSEVPPISPRSRSTAEDSDVFHIYTSPAFHVEDGFWLMEVIDRLAVALRMN